MARTEVNVIKQKLDNTFSMAIGTGNKTTVVPADGIEIKNAFANKNNTLFVIIENTDSESIITFKCGNCYPNSMLGDFKAAVTGLNIFQFQDLSRFENKDGSIYIDFASTFNGTVFAIAKETGLNPAL